MEVVQGRGDKLSRLLELDDAEAASVDDGLRQDPEMEEALLQPFVLGCAGGLLPVWDSGDKTLSFISQKGNTPHYWTVLHAV